MPSTVKVKKPSARKKKYVELTLQDGRPRGGSYAVRTPDRWTVGRIERVRTKGSTNKDCWRWAARVSPFAFAPTGGEKVARELYAPVPDSLHLPGRWGSKEEAFAELEAYLIKSKAPTLAPLT